VDAREHGGLGPGGLVLRDRDDGERLLLIDPVAPPSEIGRGGSIETAEHRWV
jgi:hypothetical protein